jgi:hypothetical protein
MARNCKRPFPITHIHQPKQGSAVALPFYFPE